MPHHSSHWCDNHQTMLLIPIDLHISVLVIQMDTDNDVQISRCKNQFGILLKHKKNHDKFGYFALIDGSWIRVVSVSTDKQSKIGEKWTRQIFFSITVELPVLYSQVIDIFHLWSQWVDKYVIVKLWMHFFSNLSINLS